VASYEYTDLYYDIYYLFVTDTDTGSGAENTGTVKEPVSSSDTGSASDAGSVTHGTQTSADSGSASETSSIVTTKSSADTGSGAEGSPVTIRFKDTDFSNNYEVDLIADTDSFTGADSYLALTPSSADTCSGSDTNTALRISDAGEDSFLAFDQAQAFPLGLADTDTGSGLEANRFLPALPKSSADTGSVNPSTGETGFTLPDIPDTDAGSGADAGESIHVALSDTDAGSGADSGGPTAPVSSADTGHGSETAAPGVSSTDAGSGADAFTGMHLTGTSDSGSGSENAGFPDNPYGHETGSFSEAGSVIAHVPSADSIQWVELGAHATPSWLLYGTLESFSLVRGAVLNGSGLESAQLYGMRDGRITPNYSEYPSTSDDIVVMVWANLEYVEIEVNSGFLPFPALTTIYGYPVSSSGAEYSTPWGLQRMTNAMPMVLRANGRNYNGQARTFDLIFYQVQFLTVHTQRAYKTGMECDYTAYATLSYTDEAGNALAVPEVGRMVDSPGQLTGAIGALAGRGT